jgi:hypothetical protein
MRNKCLPTAQPDLKEKIEKLISFEDGRQLIWKAEEAGSYPGSLHSKYRKVLTCSFSVKGKSPSSAGRMAMGGE